MAYAILETGGKQYRAEKDGVIHVERLGAEAGKSVKFDRVLLISDDKVHIGTPYIKSAYVEGEVLNHLKGKKLIAYKAIRREGGAKTKTGHRQWTTVLKVNKIQGK